MLTLSLSFRILAIARPYNLLLSPSLCTYLFLLCYPLPFIQSSSLFLFNLFSPPLSLSTSWTLHDLTIFNPHPPYVPTPFLHYYPFPSLKSFYDHHVFTISLSILWHSTVFPFSTFPRPNSCTALPSFLLPSSSLRTLILLCYPLPSFQSLSFSLFFLPSSPFLRPSSSFLPLLSSRPFSLIRFLFPSSFFPHFLPHFFKVVSFCSLLSSLFLSAFSLTFCFPFWSSIFFLSVLSLFFASFFSSLSFFLLCFWSLLSSSFLSFLLPPLFSSVSFLISLLFYSFFLLSSSFFPSYCLPLIRMFHNFFIIFEHWLESGHSVQYDKATILAPSQGYHTRKHRKTLEIMKHILIRWSL